jgi:hypothetical protein
MSTARTPIIDTPFDATDRAEGLRQLGVTTVIRYYCFRNSATFPAKCLTAREAQALCAVGLRLVTVFQQRQNQLEDFSEAKGRSTGARAHELAEGAVGQPPGSAIFFAVDFDASAAQIAAHVQPFFEGVRAALASANGGAPAYRIGVYGSGLVCKTLRSAGLSELSWLAMARGFAGTREELERGQWQLNQLPPPSTLLGLGVDFNASNPDLPDCGAFSVEADDAQHPLAGVAGPAAATLRVIARSGLRLRAGPGTGFDVIALLPHGTAVHVREVREGWALVDRNGDGAVDGFAHAAFLA